MMENTVVAMLFAEITESVMRPRIAVCIAIAIPHEPPERTTGMLTFMNIR